MTEEAMSSNGPIVFQQFMQAGAIIDAAKRKRACETLLSKQPINSIDQIQTLWVSIDKLFQANPIKLKELYDNFQKINKNITDKLKNATSERRQQFLNEFLVADKVVEKKEVESFQRANIYQSILVYCLPYVQSSAGVQKLRYSLLANIFSNMNAGMMYLSQRLLAGKLREHDYYDIYSLILEYSDFIRVYGPEYKDYLKVSIKECLADLQKQDQAMVGAKLLTDFILGARQSIIFLRRNQQDKLADTTNTLVEQSMNIIKECGGLIAVRDMQQDQPPFHSLAAFRALHLAYQAFIEPASQQSTASDALDEELFQSVMQINVNTSTTNEAALFFTLLIEHFAKSLKIYAEYQEHCFSPRIIKQFRAIASHIENVLQSNTQVCQDYSQFCFRDLFKHVYAILEERYQRSLKTVAQSDNNHANNDVDNDNSDVKKIAAAMAVLDLHESDANNESARDDIAMKEFVDNFITFCKEASPSARHQAFVNLLKLKRSFSFTEMENLVTLAEQAFAQNKDKCNELLEQRNLIADKQEQEKFDDEHEEALFANFTRVNFYSTLISQCLPLIKDETEERIDQLLRSAKRNLFKHLCVPLTIMIGRFKNSKIVTKDHYDTYLLLMDKTRDFYDYATLLQADLLRDLGRCLARKKVEPARVIGILNDLSQLFNAQAECLLFVIPMRNQSMIDLGNRQLMSFFRDLAQFTDQLEKVFNSNYYPLNRSFLHTNQNMFEQMMTAFGSGDEHPWLKQFLQLDPIYIELKSAQVRRKPSDDDHGKFSLKLDELEKVITGEDNIVAKLNKLILLLQDYSQYDATNLPPTTIERFYRLCLNLNGALLKVKPTLTLYYHHCVFTLLDRINIQIASHLRAAKASIAKASAVTITEADIAQADLTVLLLEYFKLLKNTDTVFREPIVRQFFAVHEPLLKAHADQFITMVIKNSNLLESTFEIRERNFSPLIASNGVANSFKDLLPFARRFASRIALDHLQRVTAKHVSVTLVQLSFGIISHEIPKEFYFYAYLILIEKMQFIENNYDMWWAVASENQFEYNNTQVFIDNIRFLSNFFVKVCDVCWVCNQKKLADSFTTKAMRFFKSAIPLLSDHPKIKKECQEIRDALKKVRLTNTHIESQPWNLILNSLIRHYNTPTKTENITVIRRKSQVLHDILFSKKKQMRFSDVDTVDGWVNELLALCRALQAADKQATSNDYQLLLTMSNLLSTLVASYPIIKYKEGSPKEDKVKIDKDYEYSCGAIEVAFSVINDGLQKAIANKSKVTAKSQPVPSQAADTSQVVVKEGDESPIITASTSSSSAKELAPALPPPVVAVDVAADIEKIKRQHIEAIEDIQNQAKIDADKALSELNLHQQTELATLKARNTSKQQSLTQELAKQLDAKKSKLARQYQRAKAAQETEHEEAIKDIHRQHQRAMQSAIDEHNHNMALLAQGRDQELTDLTTKHSLELQALKIEQYLDINNAREKAKAALEEQHQQTIAINREIHAFEIVRISCKRRAIEGFRPIAKATLPQKLEKMLDLFETHDIEAYVYGGWVRDFLLDVCHGPYSDYNLIVRAKPEKVRQILRVPLTSDPHEPKILRLGRITLRCSEWASLRHEPCDFTINSFISTAQGYIFDLRNNVRDLGSHWLHAAMDLDKAFQVEPSLMLRMLRLSSQVNKRIDERDLATLLKHKTAMTNIDIQLYLEQIRSLFINPQGKLHLKAIMSLDLVCAIFPGLNIHRGCLKAFPVLNDFIEQRLMLMNKAPLQYGGEQVLALFILISMLFNTSHQTDVTQSCAHVIDSFFRAYRHNVTEAQRLATTLILNRIIVGTADDKGITKPGLYSEYLDFENNDFVKQFYVAPVGPRLLAYEHTRTTKPSGSTHTSLLQKKYNNTPKL